MILSYKNISPQISQTAFIADNATIIGDVHIGDESSIWFGTVIRGDVNFIRIGKRTNIQDLSVIHVSSHESKHPSPTLIGDDVIVGHQVLLHGCTIESGCLIGMGSIVMDRVVIGEKSIIGAGSLVTEGTHIPAKHLALGRPAKVIRPLTDEELDRISRHAEHYVLLGNVYSDSKK